MTSAEQSVNIPKVRTSFRLFRNQESIAIPNDNLDEFMHDFPGHELFDLRFSSVGLVSHYETEELIKRSGRLRRKPLLELTKMVLWEGRNSTQRQLSLPRAWLGYRRAGVKSGIDLKISLRLDDAEGVLEMERHRYSDVIKRLGGIGLPPIEFVSDITIGRVKKAEDATKDALEWLARYIPEQIDLQRVYAHPNPFKNEFR